MRRFHDSRMIRRWKEAWTRLPSLRRLARYGARRVGRLTGPDVLRLKPTPAGPHDAIDLKADVAPSVAAGPGTPDDGIADAALDLAERVGLSASGGRTELIAACANFIADPSQLENVDRLVSMLVRSNHPIPDDVHVRLLRAHLIHFPYRLDLTGNLVGQMLNSGDAPMPDFEATQPAEQSVEKLEAAAEAANQVGDNIALYANLWQLALQYPESARGWARFSAAFAERRQWDWTKQALERAMAFKDIDEESVRLCLYALDTLAVQNEMKGFAWADWFDALPEHLKIDPNGVGTVVQGKHPGADALVPAMLAARPNDAKAQLVAAMTLFNNHRFAEAYDNLHRAFEIDPRFTILQVVTNYSSQSAHIMEASGKADGLADWLSEHTAGIPEIALLPTNTAPEGLAQSRRLRQVALDRGLPSAVFIAHGKTASVSVANIFNSGFALPSVLYTMTTSRVIRPWMQDYMRGGASYTTHLAPSPINVRLMAEGGVKSAIVHVRDPRQLIVSLLEHYRRYGAYNSARVQNLMTTDDEQAFDNLIVRSVRPIVEWLDGWIRARETIAVNFTTFEEFVTDRDRFLDRILALYGGDTRYFDKAGAFTEAAGTDYHRREGAIDEWRTRLTDAQIEKINSRIPEHFWTVFGWKQ